MKLTHFGRQEAIVGPKRVNPPPEVSKHSHANVYRTWIELGNLPAKPVITRSKKDHYLVQLGVYGASRIRCVYATSFDINTVPRGQSRVWGIEVANGSFPRPGLVVS